MKLLANWKSWLWLGMAGVLTAAALFGDITGTILGQVTDVSGARAVAQP